MSSRRPSINLTNHSVRQYQCYEKTFWNGLVKLRINFPWTYPLLGYKMHIPLKNSFKPTPSLLRTCLQPKRMHIKVFLESLVEPVDFVHHNIVVWWNWFKVEGPNEGRRQVRQTLHDWSGRFRTGSRHPGKHVNTAYAFTFLQSVSPI